MLTYKVVITKKKMKKIEKKIARKYAEILNQSMFKSP